VKTMSRIVFLGTPDFSVPALNKLINSRHDVVLVITQKDKQRGRGKKLEKTPVKTVAENNGIEVFQPSNINTKESIQKISGFRPDYLVVVAYGQILSPDLLKIPRIDSLNIHASLLPKYRGAAPINWAIINGETCSGISIMRIERGLDSGPVYTQKTTQIHNHMTAGELHDKLKEMGADLLVETIEKIEIAGIKPKIQDHDQATYAPMLTKEMSHINWNFDCKSVVNRVRGLEPWPGSVIFYKRKRIKIYEAAAINEPHQYLPGTVTNMTDDTIWIACRTGYVAIHELQMEGKKRMKVNEFNKGNRIEIGYRIGEEVL